MLNLSLLRETELHTSPYDFLVLPNFIEGSALRLVQADFPNIDKPGCVPLTDLHYGSAFEKLRDTLNDLPFELAISEKFNVDLSDRPTMFTVRSICRAKDGKIHTDSVSKIITILIYLNDEEWQQSGGRLRILRSNENIENYAVEVPPIGGTMVAFKRSDHSWHGHKPYEGPRRVIQMNWVTNLGVVRREQLRHRMSWWVKNLVA